jgi:hypothetical protein
MSILSCASQEVNGKRKKERKKERRKEKVKRKEKSNHY